MAIVGFNFTKIKAKKEQPPKGQIKINNSIKVTDYTETDFELDKTKKSVNIEVDYNTSFDPEIGKINLVGNVIMLVTKEKAEELAKSWEEKKAFPQDIMQGVLNISLNKCNIQALILSQQMGLPAPVQLPKVKIQESK